MINVNHKDAKQLSQRTKLNVAVHLFDRILHQSGLTLGDVITAAASGKVSLRQLTEAAQNQAQEDGQVPAVAIQSQIAQVDQMAVDPGVDVKDELGGLLEETSLKSATGPLVVKLNDPSCVDCEKKNRNCITTATANGRSGIACDTCRNHRKGCSLVPKRKSADIDGVEAQRKKAKTLQMSLDGFFTASDHSKETANSQDSYITPTFVLDVQEQLLEVTPSKPSVLDKIGTVVSSSKGGQNGVPPVESGDVDSLRVAREEFFQAIEFLKSQLGDSQMKEFKAVYTKAKNWAAHEDMTLYFHGF